jgi:hypothetical protein
VAHERLEQRGGGAIEIWSGARRVEFVARVKPA